MKESYIRTVSNYFSNISVAAFEIEKGNLKTGYTVHIKGNTTDCTNRIINQNGASRGRNSKKRG